jgi:tRNA pseudouridine55 synthase
VVCSSGTYVRVLAEDLGKRLQIGAHLTRLRRTRAGNCRLAQAVTLERLAELEQAGAVRPVLIPMAAALPLPERRVSEGERRLIAHGRGLAPAGDWRPGERVKLCGAGGELLAVAEYDARAGALQPRVVLTEAVS